MPTRNCSRCGTSLEGRDPRAKVCLDCRRILDQENDKKSRERQKKRKRGEGKY